MSAKEEKMTERQFFKLLRATPRDWVLLCGCKIRRVDRGMADIECPITALIKQSSGDVASAAAKLKLPDDLVERIIEAADYRKRNVMRRKLLRACGLKP